VMYFDDELPTSLLPNNAQQYVPISMPDISQLEKARACRWQSMLIQSNCKLPLDVMRLILHRKRFPKRKYFLHLRLVCKSWDQLIITHFVSSALKLLRTLKQIGTISVKEEFRHADSCCKFKIRSLATMSDIRPFFPSHGPSCFPMTSSPCRTSIHVTAQHELTKKERKDIFSEFNTKLGPSYEHVLDLLGPAIIAVLQFQVCTYVDAGRSHSISYHVFLYGPATAARNNIGIAIQIDWTVGHF